MQDAATSREILCVIWDDELVSLYRSPDAFRRDTEVWMARSPAEGGAIEAVFFADGAPADVTFRTGCDPDTSNDPDDIIIARGEPTKKSRARLIGYLTRDLSHRRDKNDHPDLADLSFARAIDYFFKQTGMTK